MAGWRNQKQRVSLAAWDRYRTGNFRSDRQRALACIFLNRTSFSGIISNPPARSAGENRSPSTDRLPVHKIDDHPANPQCG